MYRRLYRRGQALQQGQLQGKLGLPVAAAIIVRLVEFADGPQQCPASDVSGLPGVGLPGILGVVDDVRAGCLRQQDVAEMLDDLPGKLARVGAAIHRRVDDLQPAGQVVVQHGFDQRAHRPPSGCAQGDFGHLQGDRLGRVGHHLVQQADAVPHGAGALPSDQLQHLRLDAELFRRRDVAQKGGHVHDRHPPKLKRQAAAQDRLRHFFQFGRRQNEDGVVGWFFQGLEQRIEGCAGKAVHLVDDVDLVLPFAGRKGDLVTQLTHVVHASVGGGVDLDQVQVAGLVDGNTVSALVAGPLRRVLVQAVDRLGQQAGGGGLAGAARPAEQVSVADAALA